MSNDFSKLKWLESVLCSQLSTAEKCVVAYIGLSADRNGQNAWRANGRVIDRVDVSKNTVKRARRAAVEHRLMVVTKPAPRGAGNTRTAEYQLTMPPEIDPREGPYIGGEMGPGETRNGPSASNKWTQERPEMDPGEGPPLGSSLGYPLGESFGAASTAPEPLDVETVPGPGDALSPQNPSIENNDPRTPVVDAELIDEPLPDPEPAQYCRSHMPYGTSDSCRFCKVARKSHEAWQGRNTDRIFAKLIAEQRNEPPRRHTGNCDLCDASGWRLDHGGRDGDRPKKCDHGPWVAQA